jgi:hypothetical protein
MTGVMALIAGMLAAVAGADGGPGHSGPFGVGSVPSVAESSEGYCRRAGQRGLAPRPRHCGGGRASLY